MSKVDVVRGVGIVLAFSLIIPDTAVRIAGLACLTILAIVAILVLPQGVLGDDTVDQPAEDDGSDAAG